MVFTSLIHSDLHIKILSMKQSGFLIIEQVVTSLALAIMTAAIIRYTSYSTVQAQQVLTLISINQASQNFLVNFNTINRSLPQQSDDSKNYAQTGYTSPTVLIQDCNDHYCTHKKFTEALINNFQYSLYQINPNIKSIICLDTPPYHSPTRMNPNCNGHGDLVLKLLWTEQANVITHTYKIS